LNHRLFYFNSLRNFLTLICLLSSSLFLSCSGTESASPTPTYVISGTISGAVVSGITISLSGSATGATTTDNDGKYDFSSLANGSYTITPSLGGYSFSPASIPVTINNVDSSGNDFSSTVRLYSISGTISGIKAGGVTLKLTGGSATSSVTTGADGSYSFSGLAAGSYVVITPIISGYSFSPGSIPITITNEDSSGNDFLSAIRLYSISGTVSGVVASGVTLNLAGAATTSVAAEAPGYYSFNGLAAGSYVVTPSVSGYTFDPTSKYVTITVADSIGNDFTSKVLVVVPVPDTGQTTKYSTTFGEDADYLINAPSYADNGDGTITDNVTGLIWQKQNDAEGRSWDSAVAYCNNNTAGLPGTGWRLPTRMELLTIIDYGKFGPSIDTTYFPGTRSSPYWTSTRDVRDRSMAWCIFFDRGVSSENWKMSPFGGNLVYVRCVR
jgi:uncharacterized protein DUF1566/carboxypeptidase family protein/SdrD B-like protein